MNNQSSQSRRSAGVSIGSTSILMVFAVLCLTVFAMLSLSTARNELRLATRSADAVTVYYAADGRAADIYHTLAASYNGLGYDTPEGVEISEIVSNGVLYLNYSVGIDEFQELSVLLRADDREETLTIVGWQVVETGAWTYDDGLEVWDGESPLFFE